MKIKLKLKKILKKDISINNDKTIIWEFSLKIFDKSLTGKKPPEEINEKAKFKELKDLIEKIFSIIKITNVNPEYNRKILKANGIMHLKTDSEFMHGYTLGLLQQISPKILDISSSKIILFSINTDLFAIELYTPALLPYSVKLYIPSISNFKELLIAVFSSYTPLKLIAKNFDSFFLNLIFSRYSSKLLFVLFNTFLIRTLKSVFSL